jgi:PII-like signaling protein
MKGTLLRLYAHENRKHHHILLYEWVLEQAKKMGIHGGSAFRGIAGFGRHGVLHEEHFFELAGQLTIEIDFAVTDEEADQLLALIEREGVHMFYARIPIEYGTVGDGVASSSGKER